MTKRSDAFRQTLNHTYKSMSAHRTGRKLFFWLAGLAIATGSLTLVQAGHIGANPAANGASSGASVRVSATSTDDQSAGKPKTEVQIDSKQAAGENPTAPTTHASVTVNGQKINVPHNGSVHKTVNNDDANISVDIQNDSHGDASNQSTSSSNISIFSQSNTSVSESSQ